MDNWTQVDIFTTTAGIEPVGASLLALGIGGYQIQDANDLEDFLQHKTGYWDYYDEDLLKLRDVETTLTVYFADNEQGSENLAALRQELIRLKTLDADGEWGRLECTLTGVREEDWAFGWKKYYHPTKVGESLVICPSWESYDAKPDEIILKLDPGMAFGTGTHESTRLCMQLMQEHMPKNAAALDLGCGSGILGISAVLLGAAFATGIDIDEVAARVANENAALNAVQNRCKFVCGDISTLADGKYDLIFANIVADVIIAFAGFMREHLAENGVIIASGIIDTREEDVAAALTQAGLRIAARQTAAGWVGLAVTLVRPK